MLLAALPVLGASDPASTFDAGNRLYEQGKYAEAIRIYQNLLEQKELSPAVYFNLGNAYFKNGEVGQAVACYRIARRLEPRDPDIQANLRFARETAGFGTVSSVRWDRWIHLLGLNELTLINAGLLWLFFLLLAAGQMRRNGARTLFAYQVAAGVAATIAVLWLVVVARSRLLTPAAVVVTRDAALRYGPFEEAKASANLSDGTELAVLSRKQNWLQVKDFSNRTGWIHQNDVVVLPPG